MTPDPVLLAVVLSISLGLCVGTCVGAAISWYWLTPTMEKQDATMEKATKTIEMQRSEIKQLEGRLGAQITESVHLASIINRARAALEGIGDGD